jgi:hypothetical protein
MVTEVLLVAVTVKLETVPSAMEAGLALMLTVVGWISVTVVAA